MLAEPQIEELLGELYAGVLETARMDGFLAALGRASGSHLASLAREDVGHPACSSACTVDVTLEELGRYARQRPAQHWANACALRGRLQAARFQGLASVPLATGMFMLDGRFRLREGNAAAERMLALGWWRKCADGSMTPALAGERAAWKRARREAAAGAGSSGVPMFPVHDAHGRRAAFAALHPFDRASGEGDLPRYVLFVRPLKPALVPDAARLRTLFGLTAAEAALAVALHRTGDLSAAAAALSIGERGARTRLQSLFEKTDCRRQGDLLRMLDAISELGG